MRLFAVIIINLLLLDLFCSSEAAWWRRRRRRRRCHAPSTSTIKWSNTWDHEFTFTCPPGQAMTEFRSMYSNCHWDRVFRFKCKKNIVAKGRCHWSHYVNNFDDPIAFKCPLSGFITGISSKHDNHYEDRRFRFRCCKDHRYHRHHCTSNSDYVNDWKQPFNFKAPKNHFLVGAFSYHINSQE
ncbi:hemagglutinin/amebocyte aggregation factor-like [Actinia tenebrosa]|uniref:Hemagglutinin/amebocyte aggregation factor-like n=1 Tax=Actinia tenebrosa TaxID=6105 RepID=A0A6P8H2V2_ACTTE|nr:hemagglutinin/amebocyte aggregation factor-like [Actinia tenebrosa]